jgi:hypothetical protein
MTARSRGATRPSCAWSLALHDERAQGRPGARCTRGLVCNVHKEVRTRAYRSSGEHPAFPAQWFDGLCRALLGDEFVLPPSLPELTAKLDPVGRLSPSQSLTPATGARTTRFCRTPQRRSSCADRSLTAEAALRSLSRATLLASTAARTPRIVTTRTPLCMRRDDVQRTSFSGKEKRIIFRVRSGRPKSR